MATKKTPKKVKKIISDAKKAQNAIITKMVNSIGREMTKKKAPKTKKKAPKRKTK